MNRSDLSGDKSMLSLPDCEALNERGGCTKLNISHCIGSKCSFANSKDQSDKSTENWCRRLCELPQSKQEQISKKYYGGAMPWKKNGGM